MSIIPVAVRRPLVPRDTGEHHRTATPLELLFDLVFVVAIASNAAQLHHGLAAAHYETVIGYVLTWFAIWWAWMNYSWFASAYDNDDVGFRLLTFVIMTGALMLAAGVPDLFEDGQSVLVVAGYAVMRFAMVALWLRAASGHPERRATALWYAGGITVVQLLWIARLALPAEPSVLLPSFFVLVAAELLVPVVAERGHGYTPFHPHHIAERYGLLVIIVLGEVILSSVQAVQGAMAAGSPEGAGGHTAPYLAEPAGSVGGFGPQMWLLVAGGLLVVFSLWWAYFSRDHARVVANDGPVFFFGYGHYVVFAATAAVGAAISAAVDVVQGEAAAGVRPIALTLAVSVSLVLVTMAGLHALGTHETVLTMVPAGVASAACVLVALVVPSMGAAVLCVGLVLVAFVVHKVWVQRHHAPGEVAA
ncbi:low temperature requirement protein A [Oryzobacter sp. R7]|uniref:low temperature requirement protein A n=1 Tax=Oryzobacter faecalis TaxID=3388656 RepID=UPI00398C8D34